MSVVCVARVTIAYTPSTSQWTEIRSRPTRSANLGSSSCGGDGNKDEQKVPKQHCDDHDDEEDEESLSGANKEKEEDKVGTVALVSYTQAAESPSPTVKIEM